MAARPPPTLPRNGKYPPIVVRTSVRRVGLAPEMAEWDSIPWENLFAVRDRAPIRLPSHPSPLSEKRTMEAVAIQPSPRPDDRGTRILLAFARMGSRAQLTRLSVQHHRSNRNQLNCET